ncbi:hypothetical protein AVEN_73553-1 [Araneus ventricosus]|uniref:Uncharacterized protein n=1 Tax=Araneus ventricosus TaxID=182803 RepID=A0A4Y2TBG9_ARAVE|nr:hypothetical protein AVEN_73553-1 [Araneus ventricosus]
MTIRAAISDQQYLVKGRAINVPTNVSTSVNVLPRNADDTLVLPVVFRRKKIHKTNVAFENIRPHVIKADAECLRTLSKISVIQQRRSPHLRCLLWLKNAPIFKEDSQNEDVKEFIDKYVSCSSLLPTSRVQLQTHKHTFTCRKGQKKNRGKKCRFDIPFFPVSETTILSPLSDDVPEKKSMKKKRNEIQQKLFWIHKRQEIGTLAQLLLEFNVTYHEYVNIRGLGTPKFFFYNFHQTYSIL